MQIEVQTVNNGIHRFEARRVEMNVEEGVLFVMANDDASWRRVGTFPLSQVVAAYEVKKPDA